MLRLLWLCSDFFPLPTREIKTTNAAGRGIFLLLPLPRLQVDTEKEAKKEEMARAVLAGGSLLLDDDPFKGMSPQVWLSMLSCVLVSGWLAGSACPRAPRRRSWRTGPWRRAAAHGGATPYEGSPLDLSSSLKRTRCPRRCA